MLHTRPFTRRILLLGVLPTCLAILMLLIGFAQAQNHQANVVQEAMVSVIENSLIEPALKFESEPTLLKQAATALLYIDPVTHIAMINSDATIAESYGLPFSLKNVALDPRQKMYSTHNKTNYMSLPVEDKGWVVTGIRANALVLTHYRGYLLLLFIAACSLMICVYFANKLYNHITAPLRNILTQLRQALSNETQGDISIQKNHLYSDFVEILNEMLTMQRSTREEMQGYVDQSTKELRETLETVEIQNIELDIARKNALQASRAKSEFLANTSHELRTPLNGILGFTTLLLKTGLSDQQKDYMSTIEQSAQGLLTVINDILDFSRLETGQLTLEYKPIFVRELVEDIFSVYAPQAHEKNIRLLSVINHNVPRNLLGDPQRLKQVISNLISNAIKFSTRGNVIVRATALGEVDNQLEVKFNISDSGVGLSDEQQENLFNAFTKIDASDSRLGGGTGLGLAIAKGLVDRMNGEIGVESRVNAGSTFWFTVRLGIDRQRVSQSPLLNSLYGLRALVFDTNSASRMEATHLLTGWGVNVIEETLFTNIGNTIASRESDSFDLAILDACHEENNFDKAKTLTNVQQITSQFRIPSIILAPPSVQRLLQEDIVGFNTALVPRPIINASLHQAICSLLNIAQPMITPGAGPQPMHARTRIDRNIKVLVVDDNPSNRKLVCEFLKSLGTSAQTAEDGYQAERMAAQEHFDLILMDVQMPGMDGLETTKLIRKKECGKRTPIVALTAHAVNEQKTRLLLAGMDDFLSKPVSEEDLEHIIARWVKSDGRVTQEATGQYSVPPATLSATNPDTPERDTEEVFSWSESMILAKNKPDLATDMLNMLLESLSETEQEISQHVHDKDYELLLETVHRFHGGCCYCGVPALRTASKNMETKMSKDPDADVDELANQLIREIRRLRAWAEQHDIDALFADMD